MGRIWILLNAVTVFWAAALEAWDPAHASACYSARDFDMRLECLALATSGQVKEPFVGVWSTGSSVGLARCSTDDDGRMVLTATSETGYERHCKFARKEKISNNTWQIKLSCSGEGMRWSMTAIITVEGKRLTYHTVSHGKAGTNVYQRCRK